MLQMRGGYQNGNGHFHTIKRYDCLVGDQNDHQLNLRVTDMWYLDSLSTYHFTSKKWWVTVFVTHHRATVLRSFGKYWKAALTGFHRGLTKCQVEVKRNTDGVNVFNLNTLTWATSVHSMWSKCPHGMSCNVEDVSGEWRFVLFPQSGGHFDHLILSVPFSLHGFPAPFRRRFPALPCGVIAVYPMQTVFRLSRFGAGFGNKKTPHNNLNLTIPSGMALVRVRYVAIES